MHEKLVNALKFQCAGIRCYASRPARALVSPSYKWIGKSEFQSFFEIFGQNVRSESK
jgi:hypothetical protein